MSFFSRFPKFVGRKEGKQFIMTDFFRRVKVSDNAKNLSVFLLPYLVLDGETPEMVSNKFYSSPFYHWVVLKVNNIVDPRKEWPVPNNKVIDIVYDRYDFAITVTDTAQFEVNDNITSDENGEFIVTSVDSDNNLVYLRSQNGQTNIATTTNLTNVTQEIEDIFATAVTDPTEGIHHYIDSTHGFIIDYSISNPNIIAVTNYDYEVLENDKKRNIKVLDKQYLGRFVTSFQNLISI